jgi:hypothetical protein
MLSLLLGLMVTAIGLGLYLATLLVPTLSRSSDLVWSGVLMFYGLVLWFCAERITGGVLLGQMTAIALIGGLMQQVLRNRWQSLDPDQQAAVRNGQLLQEQWQAFQQITLSQPKSGQTALQPAPKEGLTGIPGNEEIPTSPTRQSPLNSIWGPIRAIRDSLQGRKQHGKRWIRTDEAADPLESAHGLEAPLSPSTGALSAIVYVPRQLPPGAEYLEVLETAIAQSALLQPSQSTVATRPEVLSPHPIETGALQGDVIPETPQNAEGEAFSGPVETPTGQVCDAPIPSPDLDLESTGLLPQTTAEPQAPKPCDPVVEQPAPCTSLVIDEPVTTDPTDPIRDSPPSHAGEERWPQFWAAEAHSDPALESGAIAPHTSPETGSITNAEDLDLASDIDWLSVRDTAFQFDDQPDSLLPLDAEDLQHQDVMPSALPAEDPGPDRARDLLIVSRLTDLLDLISPGTLAGPIADPTAEPGLESGQSAAKP